MSEAGSETPTPGLPEWHLVIPVKDATVGKSRLARALAGIESRVGVDSGQLADRETIGRALARDTLRAAQRAWLAYDAAQGQWDSAVFAEQGSSAALNIGGAALERRRARVCALTTDLESLKDSP